MKWSLKQCPSTSSDRILSHLQRNADSPAAGTPCEQEARSMCHPASFFFRRQMSQGHIFLVCDPRSSSVFISSTLFLWIWKAGVIHLPQEHCSPYQLKEPNLALHLGHRSWKESKFPTSFVHFCTKQLSLATSNAETGHRPYLQEARI